MKSANLEQLNEHALARAATSPPDFEVPDRTRLWAPRELAPLSYLPSFELLSPAQRLRYNQLFAVGILEQFIWFEEGLLCPILLRLMKKRGLSPELHRALDFFVAEERSHSAMFRRLLRLAEPALCKKDLRLLRLPWWQQWIFRTLQSAPSLFVAWSWLAVFFEERTLTFSRAYSQNRDDLDDQFVAAHLRHMQDESSHVQMDGHFIETFFAASSDWHKRLADRFVVRMFQAFASPHRVSRRILTEMRREFPDFSQSLHAQLLAELKSIKQIPQYQHLAFGESACRRTRHLLMQHPSMKRTWQFLCERNESV